VFRKSFTDMRAVFEERELAIRECTDFLSNFGPSKVNVDASGKVESLELIFQDQEDEDCHHKVVGKYQTSGTKRTLPCTTIITAFGCEVSSEMRAHLSPLTFDDSGFAVISDKYSCPDAPWLFAGGDLAGATMTVEAANDGKIAAWYMHEHIQKTFNIAVAPEPQLPLFRTPIDDVDISITMAGVKFPNPFGLASAPCSTTAAMIRRAFEAGWGFAVTKTFALDEHLVTNVSPRIVRGTYGNSYGPHQPGYINIELITEKTAAYWLKSIHELKRDFPDRVIIASVMVGYDKAEWYKICKLSVDAGADMIEVNLSCPHGMGEAGMGLACGQDPAIVEEITRWCKDASVTSDGRKIPVFMKLSNAVTEIAIIAQAVKRGGADGVTIMNTMPGMMDFDPKGEGWPKVGSNKLFTSGGIAGDVNRPLATRAIWSVQRFAPGLAIMATGGISSAQSMVQMLHAGASVGQICSAIQSQDYTIVQDYITGLQAYLYRLGRGDFEGKEFQNCWESSRPWRGGMDERLVEEPEPVKKLPKFGKYLHKRVVERKTQVANLDVQQVRPAQHAPMPSVAPLEDVFGIPPLASIVQKTSKTFAGLHGDLNREEQVIAVVNPDSCINCGRCYMTCNDNAYQAISFDDDTHIPEIIEDKCTGCGLCQAVCPVPGCIEYRKMPHKFLPHRGLNVPNDRYMQSGVSLARKEGGAEDNLSHIPQVA